MLHRGSLVLISTSLLSTVLGSVHAFSVFLEPLESQFSASRSAVSFSYSLALVCLTIVVLLGHRLFHQLRSPVFVLVACLIAAAGILFAAFAPSLPFVWLGYGVLFGGANGLGYGFGLQFAAQANPTREGLAMGIVTACYALGAAISPGFFELAILAGGYQLAMLGLAAVLVVISPICVWLLVLSGVQFQGISVDSTVRTKPQRNVGWMWLGYGAAVAAGLMVIGHATAIVRAAGVQDGLWLAPVVIAILNMIGSFVGGVLTDRFRPVLVLSGAPIVAAIALYWLSTSPGGTITFAALGIVGFTYGALIASYPAVVLKTYGARESTRVYGRIFTAWGTAGLFAPLLAGYLFDRAGNYTISLLTAAGFSALSAAVVATIFFKRSGSSIN